MTVIAQPLAPRPASVTFRSVAFWCLIVLSAFGLWTLKKNSVPVMLSFPASAVVDVAVLVLSLAVGLWLARRIMRPVQAPPWSGTWLALMWGGLGACGVAIVMNSLLLSAWSQALSLDTAGSWSAALTAPINEETVKAAGVALLAAVSSRLVRSAADGLVYGALIGLAFQVMENFTYGLNEIIVAGGVEPVAATVQVLWIRILLTGFGSHWAMTAVAGAGIGYLVSASGRSAARRVGVAAGCLLLAMGMHWLFDSPLLGGIAGTLAKPLVNFAIVMAVYVVVRRRFRARWNAVADEEIAAGCLTLEEAQSLSRRRSRRRYLQGFPFGPERGARERLQRLQLALLEERVPERLAPGVAEGWRDAITAERPVPR